MKQGKKRDGVEVGVSQQGRGKQAPRCVGCKPVQPRCAWISESMHFRHSATQNTSREKRKKGGMHDLGCAHIVHVFTLVQHSSLAVPQDLHECAVSATPQAASVVNNTMTTTGMLIF